MTSGAAPHNRKTALDGTHRSPTADTAVPGSFFTIAPTPEGRGAAAGPFTVDLVCDVLGGSIVLRDSTLTAVFVGQ